MNLDLFSAANPWEWLFGLFGWCLWLLALAGGLIMVLVVLHGLAKGIKSWFKPAKKPMSRISLKDLMESRAILRFGYSQSANERIDAFVEGSLTAYDELTK